MKTTNKYQEHYMIAKATLEALEAAMLEDEQQFIIDNGIANPDGSIPDSICAIEDEATFDRMNTEHAAKIEASGEWADILTAREILKRAENDLIAYGLSLAPPKERAVLAEAAQKNYTTRLKLIDMTLKLDASTVK